MLLTAKHGSYLIVICDILCCILFIVLYKVGNQLYYTYYTKYS
jgi:hypothetical protein